MKKKTLPVSEIMTENPFTVTVNTKLAKAINLFDNHHVRHLPVLSGSKLVGILSRTDIDRLSFSDEFGENEVDADSAIMEMFLVGQVMNGKPITVSVTQSIEEVAQKLIDVRFHALPVVDGEDLAGIVTTTDVIRFLLQAAN
jgi:CBS domain-containing protein